jgi:hypothetical protein
VQQARNGISNSAQPDQHLALRLDFVHALGDNSRSRREVELTSRGVIDRGGRVDFAVQQIRRSSRTAHATTRVSITATMLEFIPQAPDDTGALAIPLAAVTSLQIDQGILIISFRDSDGKLRRISFKDLAQSAGPPASTTSDERCVVAGLRNVIAGAKQTSEGNNMRAGQRRRTAHTDSLPIGNLGDLTFTEEGRSPAISQAGFPGLGEDR